MDNKLQITYFKDNVYIIIVDDGFQIQHSHWFSRRYDFIVLWEEVEAIKCFQSMPCVMWLQFRMCNDRQFAVNDKSNGWIEFLASIHSQFPGFDWNSYESAKFSDEKHFICWLRKSGDTIR